MQLAKPAEKIPLKKRPRPDREDPRGTRHAALRSPAPPGPGHFSDFSYPKPALGFNDSGYGDAFDRGRLGRSSRGRGRGAYADRGDRVYADRGFGGGGYDRGYDRGFGEPLRPYSRDGPPSRGYASRGGYERDYPPERGTAYAELDRPPYEGRSAGGGYASRGGAFVDVVGGPYDDLERVPGFIERRGDVNMARGAFDDRKGDFGRIGDGGFGARGVELEPYRKLQRGGSYAAGMGKYPGQVRAPLDSQVF